MGQLVTDCMHSAGKSTTQRSVTLFTVNRDTGVPRSQYFTGMGGWEFGSG